MAERIVSPGVFTREKDLSFLPQGISEIGAALIGPTLEGPAFVPTVVRNFGEFEETFGDRPHAIYRNLYNDPRVQEWVVPEGHYFMMGDNRDQSNDSRFWGFVPDENVVGRAFAVWMHKDPGLSMPTFSTTRWIR